MWFYLHPPAGSSNTPYIQKLLKTTSFRIIKIILKLSYGLSSILTFKKIIQKILQIWEGNTTTASKKTRPMPWWIPKLVTYDAYSQIKILVTKNSTTFSDTWFCRATISLSQLLFPFGFQHGVFKLSFLVNMTADIQKVDQDFSRKLKFHRRDNHKRHIYKYYFLLSQTNALEEWMINYQYWKHICSFNNLIYIKSQYNFASCNYYAECTFIPLCKFSKGCNRLELRKPAFSLDIMCCFHLPIMFTKSDITFLLADATVVQQSGKNT